jgi:fumarate reductase subunit C
MVGFHFVTMILALVHAITWFNATPKAMVFWRGEERVPGAALILPNYVLWAGVSAFVFWAVVCR